MPAHTTAVGKLLLSFQSDAEIERLYAGHELIALAPNTIRELAALKAHIVTIRRDRVAYDDAESSAGVHCVAAPIYDHNDRPGAAVAGPSPGAAERRPRRAWSMRPTAWSVRRPAMPSIAL